MKTAEVRRWTREEYEKLIAAGMFPPGERVELIDGEILQMTPQGSPHATAIQLMENALRTAFGPGFSVRQQLPLALDPRSEPEPDVAVVAGNPRDYRDRHPGGALLAAEISDTTLEYDRQRKGAVYARAGIQDYWIVNLDDRSVEVYRDPGQAAYRSSHRYGEGDHISPLAALKAKIAVADILP
jgi:Uma2 family endonuclease